MPGRLLGEAFQTCPFGRRFGGRSRTRWINDISWLALVLNPPGGVGKGGCKEDCLGLVKLLCPDQDKWLRTKQRKLMSFSFVQLQGFLISNCLLGCCIEWHFIVQQWWVMFLQIVFNMQSYSASSMHRPNVTDVFLILSYELALKWNELVRQHIGLKGRQLEKICFSYNRILSAYLNKPP